MTRNRPATNVEVLARRPTPQVPTDTGVWFVTGQTERGPVADPVEVVSLGGYVDTFGDRVAHGYLYDALDVYFREGGTRAYVSRVAGADHAPATVTLSDAGAEPAPTLKVDAQSSGEWGNALTVAVEAGSVADTFVLVVALDGTEVERSPNLADPTAAVAWGELSDYVTVSDLASPTAAPDNNPAVVAATPLAGGTDDRLAIAESDWQMALDAFGHELGPGQVSAPGHTTSEGIAALFAHAEGAKLTRTAFADSVDSTDLPTLSAQVDAVRADADVDATFGGIFAPWLKVPGLPGMGGVQRTIPPSSLAAAKAAASDAAHGHANVAAAGDNGRALYVAGVTQTFTDAERSTLNTAGINLIAPRYGAIKVMGWRTCADPDEVPEWRELSHARLRSQIVAETLVILERFLFDPLDGRGLKRAELGGVVAGMLKRLHEGGALYGATPSDAYRVDVGDPVNTDATAAAGELNVLANVRMSPFAEQVNAIIVKHAITAPIS